jgi:SPX domain protein involved in polyphosphate accumulation
MKFSEYYNSEVVKKWKFYYVDYKRLKTELLQKDCTFQVANCLTYPASSDYQMTRIEKEFMENLEKELEKVNSFYSLECDNLYQRVLLLKEKLQKGVIILHN